MHPHAASFRAQARQEYGFDPAVEEFPEGTETAADAAAAVGCDVAQIASSLGFDVGGDLVVSVTSGANRVNEAALGAHFDAPAEAVSLADPDRIERTLGWAVGGVPPFCHDRPVPVVLDETLLAYDTVWAAAGTPEAVFPVDPDRLRTLADADSIPVVD